MTRLPRLGQATTELALGSLVFVTILMFGIHFGEAGYGLLKAKEAALFAVHDASGARTHLFSESNVQSGSTYAPFSPAQSGTQAQAQYAGGWKGVMTQAAPVRVRCRSDDTVSFQVQRPGGMAPDSRDAVDYLRSIYKDRGGVSCEARSNLALFRLMPKSFAEGNDGFFKAQNSQYTDIPICGTGMPQNGACTGRLAALTGDWAFEGPIGHELNDDVRDVRNNLVQNKPYRRVVEELFDLAGGPYSSKAGDSASPPTPAQQLMKVGGGVTPAQVEWIDETRFAMSYRGDTGAATVDVPMQQVDPMYNAALEYPTLGADLEHSEVRWNRNTGRVSGVPRCFLSLYGCPSNPKNPFVGP